MFKNKNWTILSFVFGNNEENVTASLIRLPQDSLIRLLFLLATEHTLLRIILNIWEEFLFPGDLHDVAL